MPEIPRADPEYASAVFGEHLEQFWAGGRPTSWGWSLARPDPLHALVTATAQHPDGHTDPYWLFLDAVSYDQLPPGVYFVDPDDPLGPRPSPETHLLPRYENVPFPFAIHPRYTYPDQVVDQLVCFSQSRDYYVSGHNPGPGEAWTPGFHTVASTLNRLHEVLSPRCYRGPLRALAT